MGPGRGGHASSAGPVRPSRSSCFPRPHGNPELGRDSRGRGLPAWHSASRVAAPIVGRVDAQGQAGSAVGAAVAAVQVQPEASGQEDGVAGARVEGPALRAGPGAPEAPVERAVEEDVLLVHSWEGEPLPREHGGPVRMITPKLYAWKGAKWIRRIEFLAEDRLGFWEERGYSNTAEPWFNDRYSSK